MTSIAELLGDQADTLLNFKTPKIAKAKLHVPGPDFVDRIFAASDRNNRVLVNLQRIFSHGRLGGSGYVSILPVDQGIEHSGGASFAKNPDYFDPENIVRLAVEGGCNAVASTLRFALLSTSKTSREPLSKRLKLSISCAAPPS